MNLYPKNSPPRRPFFTDEDDQSQSPPETERGAPLSSTRGNINWAAADLDDENSDTFGTPALVDAIMNGSEEDKIKGTLFVRKRSVGAIGTTDRARRICNSDALITALVYNVTNEDGMARCHALGIFRNLTANPETRDDLCHPDVGLIPSIAELLRRKITARQQDNAKDFEGDDNDDVSLVCGVLKNCSTSRQVCKYLSSAGLGLLEVLAHVLQADRGAAQLHAASTLANIAKRNSKDFARLFTTSDTVVSFALAGALYQEKEKLRLKCCEVVLYLANGIGGESGAALSKLDTGVVAALLFVVSNGLATARPNDSSTLGTSALLALLTKVPDNRMTFVMPELQLVEVMMDILRQGTAPSKMRDDAMTALESLTAVPMNRDYLAEPSLGLVAMLTMLVKLSGSSDSSSDKKKAGGDLQRRAKNIQLLLGHQA